MSGRPSKFRPEIGERIVDFVRVTGMLELAAEAFAPTFVDVIRRGWKTWEESLGHG